MLNAIRRNIPMRIAVVLLPLLLFWVTMFSTGFASDVATAILAPLPTSSYGGLPALYAGPTTLEERILTSDVIARVRLLSISDGAESKPSRNQSVGVYDKTAYVKSLEYRFEVLEYLRGSGSNEIVVFTTDDVEFENRLSAELFTRDLRGLRDSRWDDREAIIFAPDYNAWFPHSAQQTNRYWLGPLLNGGEKYYEIDGEDPIWLPASSPIGASGVSGASSSGSSGQAFLTASVLPWNGGASGGVSGASAQLPSITLSELKKRIADIEEEIAEGDGSEEYIECLQYGYEWERQVQYRADSGRYIRYIRRDHEIGSGLPAGSSAYSASWAGYRDIDDPKGLAEYWLDGKDKGLFVIEHPGVVYTVRPLPKGEYRTYYNERLIPLVICDAYPDLEKNRREHFVQVIAPDGTLHEAFFDPVDIGTAVGADSSDGVLEPASFSLGGDTTIHRIEWESGRVRMQLDPPSTLAKHHIDFIDLDGNVSLRLGFDDAVSVSDGNAGDVLTWGVCEQPWQSGDLLMLRISRSELGLTDATNDADCAAAPDATPTPEAIPTATPTAEATPAPDATPTTTTIPMSETTPSPTPTTIPITEPTQTATPAPVALTPPSKPLNLTASTQDNSITLTWDDPDDSTITGYLIFRRQPNIDRQFTLIADTTGMPASSYTDTTGIEQGKRYLYRVRAINSAGQSAASEPAVVETASLLPAAPQNLSAEATHNTVTLSWDGLDASITGYQILRRVAADPAGFVVIVDDTGTSESEYVDAVGVEPATHYIYRVVGINDEGLGKPSQPVQAMTLEVPAAPTPTQTPTVMPTATPTVMPTATPTVMPTATPEPGDGVSGAIDTPTPTPTPEPDDGVSGSIDTPIPVPTPEPTATPTLEPTATPTPTHEPDDGVSGAIDTATPVPTPEPDDGVGGAIDAPTPTPTPEPDGVGGAVDPSTPTATPEPAEGVSGS